MPFINLTPPTQHTTICYNVRAAYPHVGVSYVTLLLAQQFSAQQKKVLVFDNLLGLKNLNLKNPNASSIENVLVGKYPLSELIFTHQNFDVICGVANTNLNALSFVGKQHIQSQLQILSQNYDVLICDVPPIIEEPLFASAQSLWVVSMSKRVILATLKYAESTPQLILNKTTDNDSLQNLTLMLRQTDPEAKIFQTVPLKK